MPLKKNPVFEEKLAEERRQAEERDAQRRAQKIGFPYLNLISVKTPTEVKAMVLVPEAQAKETLLVPLQLVKKTLVIAAFDPELPQAKAILEDLKKKYEIKLYVASLNGLKHAWSYYQYVKEAGPEISGKVEIDEEHLHETQDKIRNLKDFAVLIENFKSPLISQILEIVLAGALAMKSSDIHLEPTASATTLRLRIDGLLHVITEKIDKKTYQPLISRIKLLSGLKLNIHDQPQDGRFTIDLKDRDIEIRTSVIPSEYGETIVMRLLDPLALKTELEELGWRKDDLEIAAREIEKPHGLILNTGPTGSGKTTTLYAFLKKLTTPEVKIITIEDPIEYHLLGISQTQVDPGAGYNFASGLRSILRQDPDIILVGEIRDKETAEIAMNASLTGHLVFSTLHTNDAVGAVPRLIDLGAKSQILGPALTLVIAQRLVRVLCPDCKVEQKINEAVQEKIEKFIKELPARVDRKPLKNYKIYEAGRCEKCAGLGYRGRTSIFELFVVTREIEELIYTNPNEISLKELAKKQGMVTMQEDGVLKVLAGITDLAEVERVTGPVPIPA
jgi:type II secretory ATPase GspE/PulE/Tfp pilus assembly ATPase PilB-like protein